MRKALMWTGIGVGAAVGAFYAIRSRRGAVGRVKEGLGRAERVAGTARSVIETAQRVLHTTKQAI